MVLSPPPIVSDGRARDRELGREGEGRMRPRSVSRDGHVPIRGGLSEPKRIGLALRPSARD